MIRLTFSRGASGTIFSGTFSTEDRCILTTINGMERHSTGGARVTANRVRIRMARLQVLNGDRAPPFRVIPGYRATRAAELGCHCLSLHEPSLRGGVLLERGVAGVAHSCFSRGNFVRVRAPVLVHSAPRNTHSFLMPSEVRGNDFCTLPRSPRLCGRLSVITNFSECVRVTHYFHSRSLHTSHRPRFARVSLRVSFISVRSILSVNRNCVGHIFGSTVNISIPAPLPEVACGRTVGHCNSSGPSAECNVRLVSVASRISSSRFIMFGDTATRNNAIETVGTGGTMSTLSEGRVSGLASCMGNVNTGNLT